MSILIRLLPFWVAGILVSWAAPVIFPGLPGINLIFWILAVIASFNLLPGRLSVLPGVSWHICLLVFLSAVEITRIRTGSDKLPAGRQIEIYGRVVKIMEGERSWRTIVKVFWLIDGDNQMVCRETILLQSGRLTDRLPDPGNIIRSVSNLELIPKKDNPTDFPERLYHAGDGVRRKGWIKELELTDTLPSKRFNFSKLAARLQQSLCDKLDNSPLGDESSSIIKAMLLGRKDFLNPDTRTLFQQNGISHLLVVSGLHAGLIYLIITRLLFFLKRSGRSYIAEILAVTAVWGYSMLTGFGSSVQRASLMISLFALSRIISRRSDPLQVLVAAFFIQTAFDPLAIFRFGFQLSYLAVAGILVLYKSWTNIIKTSKQILRKIWDFAGVSIAAQSFTLPFVLIYFHEFPLYFILGNLILVPPGLLVFYLGTLFLGLSGAGLDIPFLAVILDTIIQLMVGAGEIIASLPFAVIRFDHFGVLDLLIYFSIMVPLLFFRNINWYRKLLWILPILLGGTVFRILINL